MSEFEPDREQNELDRKLAQALHHVDAPLGFADRVMSRATPNHVAPRKFFVMQPRVRAWASVAMAAMLAVGVFFGEQLHQRHERSLATQQFETATRITDATLAHTREQLVRAGVPLK